MALHAARSELNRMLNEVERMFEQVLTLVSHPNKKMSKVAEDILNREDVVDLLEKEISEYLVPVTQLELSMEQSHEIGGILQCVNDIERMGDHCEILSRLATKRYKKKLPFSSEAMNDIVAIGDEVKKFIIMLQAHIFDSTGEIMKQAKEYDEKITALHKKIRKGHIKRLNSQDCSVMQGLIYIDMLTSFQRIGDHAHNVAQVFAGER